MKEKAVCAEFDLLMKMLREPCIGEVLRCVKQLAPRKRPNKHFPQRLLNLYDAFAAIEQRMVS